MADYLSAQVIFDLMGEVATQGTMLGAQSVHRVVENGITVTEVSIPFAHLSLPKGPFYGSLVRQHNFFQK